MIIPKSYKMPMSGDPQMETMDDPEPVEAEEKKPPNLRDAMSEAPICGTCQYFAGASCKKFDGYPVKYHEGCDAHSDIAAEQPEDSDMQMERPAPTETDEEQ